MQSSQEKRPSESITMFASKLGVDLRATPREIREAYIKLKRVYSGRSAAYSMVTDEQRVDHLKELEVAYSGLTEWAEVNVENPGHLAVGLRADIQKPKSYRGVRVNLETTDKVKETIARAEKKEGFASGKFLAAIREAHGLSVKDVNDSLKISREFILAVEAEDFSSLPAPIYVKGFLKNLLRHLSVDRAGEFLDQYLKKYNEWHQIQKTNLKTKQKSA